MSTEKIKAEPRTEFGKGAARRIRRESKVPAVVYGHGNDPVHLTLPGHDTMMAIKHGGANTLLELEFDGRTQLALTKQIQVDPVRRTLEHVDFVAVRRGEKVTVDVPVHLLGEAAPETLVVTEQATIEVEAEATHIPETIEVDITDAAVGTQIHAADLSLPSGTTLLTDGEALIVNVIPAPTAEQLEAELEEAEGDLGIERDEPEAVEETAGEDATEAESEASDTPGEGGGGE